MAYAVFGAPVRTSGTEGQAKDTWGIKKIERKFVKMEKKSMRFLSLLLALVMVIGLMPVGHAHAEEAETVLVLGEMVTSLDALVADSDYVICDTNPAEGILFNGETISLYDKVIVKGDDLYDGKVIH